MNLWLRTGFGLVVALCACADSHRERRGSPMDPAAMSGGGLGQAGGGTEPSTPDHVLGDPGSPAETQVWIGQLWVTGGSLCHPTKPATWQPPGTTYRVVLVLEPNATGERGGRIRIGDAIGASLPEAPSARWMNWEAQDPNDFWECSAYHATEGFEYTLFDVVRTETQLRFSYAPYELWNRWCETTKPVCPESGACWGRPFCLCENGACKADVSSRTTVWLSATRDTLEGEFPGEQPSAIRLRRAR